MLFHEACEPNIQLNGPYPNMNENCYTQPHLFYIVKSVFLMLCISKSRHQQRWSRKLKFYCIINNPTSYDVPLVKFEKTEFNV